MRQVSFTLLMRVVLIVIEPSTRGTVHSDNWFLQLSEQGLLTEGEYIAGKQLSEQALLRSYHPLDYG